MWTAADQLRANSALGPNEYRGPVLGLIFLAYAEHRFEEVRPEVEGKATVRHPATSADYKARSVLFIPEEARLSYLVNLPEREDLGGAVDTAMRLVENRKALQQMSQTMESWREGLHGLKVYVRDGDAKDQATRLHRAERQARWRARSTRDSPP